MLVAVQPLLSTGWASGSENIQTLDYFVGQQTAVNVVLPEACPAGKIPLNLKLHGKIIERYEVALSGDSSGPATVRKGEVCPDISLGLPCTDSQNTTYLTAGSQTKMIQFTVAQSGGAAGHVVNAGSSLVMPGRVESTAALPFLRISSQAELQAIYLAAQGNGGVMQIQLNSSTTSGTSAQLPAWASFSTFKKMRFVLGMTLVCSQ